MSPRRLPPGLGAAHGAPGELAHAPASLAPLEPAALLDVEAAARHLLGAELRRVLPDGRLLSGKIVETEAYAPWDPASHSFRGRTARNAAMFGPPGHAYVYFIYGMHWCFNVSAGADGEGSAVLVRALEPLLGIESMRVHRNGVADAQLTNGPGKLARALGIDRSLDGHDLRLPPLQIVGGGGVSEADVVVTTRVGLSAAKDAPLRFYVRGVRAVSRR